MKWYQDKIFWCIFSATAAVKLAAFIYVCFFHPAGESVLSFPDSIGYVYPAQTFLQDGSLWESVSVSPMLLRTPGYPLFLALVQLLTGNMTWAVALWQNILSLLLLIPVYLTALRLKNQTAARWSTFFCAVSVLYFSLAFAVLTETLCAFLLAWFVFFMMRFFQTPKSADLFCAALLLAAAVYVRPAAYYLMPVTAIILLCFCSAKLIRFPVLKTLALFIAPLVIAVGAWHARNAVTAGFNGFTSVGAYNLYIWNEDYLARKYNVPVAEAHGWLENALPPGFSSLPPARQVQLYKALAAPLIRESFLYKLSRAPFWAGKTLLGTNFAHTAKLLNLASESSAETDPENTLPADWKSSWPAAVLFFVSAGQVFATVLLGAAGLWLLWKRKRPEAFFLTVYCVYFWGIGSVFYGAYARFRTPFEFVLCIGAGILIARLTKRLQTDGQTVN